MGDHTAVVDTRCYQSMRQSHRIIIMTFVKWWGGGGWGTGGQLWRSPGDTLYTDIRNTDFRYVIYLNAVPLTSLIKRRQQNKLQFTAKNKQANRQSIRSPLHETCLSSCQLSRRRTSAASWCWCEDAGESSRHSRRRRRSPSVGRQPDSGRPWNRYSATCKQPPQLSRENRTTKIVIETNFSVNFQAHSEAEFQHLPINKTSMLLGVVS